MCKEFSEKLYFLTNKFVICLNITHSRFQIKKYFLSLMLLGLSFCHHNLIISSTSNSSGIFKINHACVIKCKPNYVSFYLVKKN